MKTKPKRSCRRNAWGNVVGYESGRRAYEFGCEIESMQVAEQWVLGGTAEEAREAYYSGLPFVHKWEK